MGCGLKSFQKIPMQPQEKNNFFNREKYNSSRFVVDLKLLELQKQKEKEGNFISNFFNDERKEKIKLILNIFKANLLSLIRKFTFFIRNNCFKFIIIASTKFLLLRKWIVKQFNLEKKSVKSSPGFSPKKLEIPEENNDESFKIPALPFAKVDFYKENSDEKLSLQSIKYPMELTNDDFCKTENKENITVQDGPERPENKDKEHKTRTFRFSGAIKAARPVLTFAIFLIILILPFKLLSYYQSLNDAKGRVLGIAESGVDDMAGAFKNLSEFNFNQAGENFSEASGKFTEAKNEIDEVSGILKNLATLLPVKEAKLASQADLILEAGSLSAKLGEELSAPFKNFSESDKLDLNLLLENFYSHSAVAKEYSDELIKTIDKIDVQALPEKYQEQFLTIKEKSGSAKNSLNDFIDLLNGLKIFLGVNNSARYLFVFQNNSELRGSGGFIGSFALVDFKDGKIANIYAPGGGSYDTEGGLKERISAPAPLHLVNSRWYFWDANWWPDWPTTARKLQWFYEKSGGPTVDGVIAITPDVFEDILKILGPIDMRDQYGIEFTSDNFWLEIQKLAEEKAEENSTKKHEPKKIIGDLIGKIIKEFPQKLDKNKLGGLANALLINIKNKNILLYFNNEELNKTGKALGAQGEIKNTKYDYLMVVNTNIAGGKSDRVMNEEINMETEIAADGSIINSVKIKRQHQGNKKDEFTGMRNVNWMRVYVPLGSELLDARGFTAPAEKYFDKEKENLAVDPDIEKWEAKERTDEKSGTKIYNELDKTVFANWTMADPGEIVIVYLKYKLPFKLESIKPDESLPAKINNLVNNESAAYYPYALLVQKQPGAKSAKFYGDIKIANTFTPIWNYGESMSMDGGGIVINTNIDSDKIFGLITKK